MCYELVILFIEDFAPYVSSLEELDHAILSTALFIFYHELGHALVDVLDLPITGREEDAVDQLSTLVLLSAGEEGREAALTGAVWFGLRASAATGQLPFWDEHSLDEQRFYNILCLVYGSDPESGHYLVEEGLLPQERAIRCPNEYEQMDSSWNQLLSGYLR